MRLIKLTDADGQTRGRTQWAEGAIHQAKPGDGPLCSEYWIHAYKTPLLAVLCNPLHANIGHPIGWEAEGDIGADDGLKVGSKALTTLRRIDLPVVSIAQRVRWGILCALKVRQSAAFETWAARWLSGKDRSGSSAAEATEKAAAAAVWAETRAEKAAAWAGAWATAAAARAAEAATAEAEKAATEAEAAKARAAWAAAEAAAAEKAAAAATAAAAAVWAGASIDFVSLAERAVMEEP